MIFYFTGTGNSLYVARALDSEPVSIPQIIHRDRLVFNAEQIGIVCPVYGHEMPAMVKDFIRRATFGTPYFYVILTYGNMHGGAAKIAQRMIESAGKKADYINTVMMVDNFLPVFDMEKQMALDKNVDGQIAAIHADVQQRRRYIQKASIKDKFVHNMYTRMVNGEPEQRWAAYRVTLACIGCGTCARVCPAGCIRVENGKAVHHLEDCQACMACIHACPQMAIKMADREANPDKRYRHEAVTLPDLIAANNQTGGAAHD